MDHQSTIRTLSRKELLTGLFKAREPFLITEGVSDWPAMTRWSPNYLRSLNSQRLVDVAVSQSGHWKYNPDGSAVDPKQQYTIANVSFDKATDWIVEEKPYPKYYVSKVSIGDKLPELQNDLCFPSLGGQINLWFGSAGTVYPLHFDMTNNLFAQIQGSKKFTLFSPQQTPYLYSFPEKSRLSHFSYVDVEGHDFAAHPLYINARSLTLTLHPGQMLFLPVFWWHQVKSESISISVSQWFTPALSQCCGPNALRFLISEFKRDGWDQLRKLLGLSTRGMLDSAEDLLRASPAAAVLAVAASLRTCRADGEALAQNSVVRDKLGRLVGSVLEEPNTPISIEEMALVITRSRLLIDKE
jgi:hypothetical protein